MITPWAQNSWSSAQNIHKQKWFSLCIAIFLFLSLTSKCSLVFFWIFVHSHFSMTFILFCLFSSLFFKIFFWQIPGPHSFSRGFVPKELQISLLSFSLSLSLSPFSSPKIPLSFSHLDIFQTSLHFLDVFHLNQACILLLKTLQILLLFHSFENCLCMSKYAIRFGCFGCGIHPASAILDLQKHSIRNFCISDRSRKIMLFLKGIFLFFIFLPVLFIWVFG